MARVFLFMFAAHVVLLALALISCLSADRQHIRALPRLLWVPLIVLVPVLGPVAWFVLGRPATRRRPGPGVGKVRRPARAPDDDPDFLRSLDAEQARRDRELLEQWEAELRRREDELRRGDETPRPDGAPD
jgi:hypothetical protein